MKTEKLFLEIKKYLGEYITRGAGDDKGISIYAMIDGGEKQFNLNDLSKVSVEQFIKSILLEINPNNDVEVIINDGDEIIEETEVNEDIEYIEETEVNENIEE